MKKSETGRSMVEMLATLSVIALLSVGGLAMWGVLMSKHKANTVLDEAQKRATVVAGQIGFLGNTPSLAEFTQNETAGGTFDTTVVTEEFFDQFGIKISGVEKAVCQNILNSIGSGTSLRRLSLESSPRSAVVTCENSGNYLMIYNNDLKSEISDTEYCEEDKDCKTVCGVCTNKHICSGECEVEPKECTNNAECEDAGVCAGCFIEEGQESGVCQYACQGVEYLESNGNQYIDTGYYPSDETMIRFKYMYKTTSGYSFIGRRTGNESNGFRYFAKNGTTYLDYGSGKDKNRISATYVTSNSDIYETEIGNRYIKDIPSDNIVVSDSKVTFPKKTFTFCLFSNYQNSTNKGRIYYCKIWDNGNLVRDFIPVLAPDKDEKDSSKVIPAMLDRANEHLYINVGSEQFTTDKN